MAEGYAFALTVIVFIGSVMLAGDGCDARRSRVKRCESSCAGRGDVFERKNGVCTCRDGSVWLWKEGYTRRLGGDL